MRTIANIQKDIDACVAAREARAAVPSEDGKWDECRALFIEACNNRLEKLQRELDCQLEPSGSWQ